MPIHYPAFIDNRRDIKASRRASPCGSRPVFSVETGAKDDIWAPISNRQPLHTLKLDYACSHNTSATPTAANGRETHVHAWRAVSMIR